MTRQRAENGRRGASAAVLLVGGGAVAVAAWVGGHPGVAAIVLGVYVGLGLIAFVWSGGPGDVAAIMRGGPDERQHAIDLRATAISGTVTGCLALGAAIVNIARTGGDPGAYGVVCMAFGISYGVALAVLRRRA
jgi:hypothetical protein